MNEMYVEMQSDHTAFYLGHSLTRLLGAGFKQIHLVP